ncbi:MAG: hypothetical protein HZA23_08640 [Nitrospirae bacterium]|nr:hypothetical protein [Nitrospirota bacterium]
MTRFLWLFNIWFIPALGQAEEPVDSCEKWTLLKTKTKKEVVLALRHRSGRSVIVTSMEEDLRSDLSRFLSLTCNDIDGDGYAEAIVQFYSGGAHCCWDYSIYFARPDGNDIAHLSLDVSGRPIEGWRDLDGDGKKEALTHDDRWDNFDGMSHAASPFPPKILCLGKTRFIDCTSRFPEILLKASQEFEDELIRLDDFNERAWGATIGLFHVWSRLGNEPEGWRRIKQICPPCEVALKQDEQKIRQRLAE